MFYINSTPILASALEVLTELKNQLALNGIIRFNEFRVGLNNIQFNCPIHSSGQERKPSCGILTTDRGEQKAGVVHCFSCGYTATLEEMISHCFGKDDFGNFGREWLVKNFLTVAVENRKDIDLDIKRGGKKDKERFVNEVELNSYRVYHPYMFQRKMTDEAIEHFDVGYDKETNSLTFPVRDTLGRTLFIARRNVDFKYFNYPVGVDKPVYGLYELNNPEEVIVCESMIDAITCYVYGKQAVALLGLGTNKQYEQLKQLKCRKLITAFDPDVAGLKATNKLREKLSTHKIITSYELPTGKDINDLTKEEFDNLVEYF